MSTAVEEVVMNWAADELQKVYPKLTRAQAMDFAKLLKDCCVATKDEEGQFKEALKALQNALGLK